MALKFPPPPFLTDEMQPLNRWLLEIQSILNAQGTINPSQVAALPGTITQVGNNTVDITTLFAAVTANTNAIAVNTAAIAANVAAIAALDVRITALEARGEVLNGTVAPLNGQGKVNDWFADTVAKKIYVKTGAATWTTIL